MKMCISARLVFIRNRIKERSDRVMMVRPHIVLFGDSITELSIIPGGWGAALTKTYSRKADVIVRGYSGYNTKMALPLLQKIFPLDSKPPAAATVFFGANDACLPGGPNAAFHVPLKEYKENLEKIVLHLKKCNPIMLIVLITPPPVDDNPPAPPPPDEQDARSSYGQDASARPDRTNVVTGTYVAKCVELAKELGLRSINLWSKMQETPGWQKIFLGDGVHLTAAGSALVHKEVVRVFKEKGFGPEALPYDFPYHSEIACEEP